MAVSETDVDPVTLEVLWQRLRSVPAEMGSHFSRTAYSPIIKYADDLSTGLFTEDGRLIAQGVYTPGQLGPMPFTMREILASHFGPDEWEPGDVVLTNDPSLNSGHLPDFFMFEPVFLDDELVGFTGTTGHYIDLGGAAPGSYTMQVIDRYGEGLQIPPIKIYKGGEPVEEAMAVIGANSRMPTHVLGDVRAQRGASKVGADLYRDIVREYGVDTVRRYVAEIFDRSETTMRDAIDEMPNGTYRFEDHLDGLGEPLTVCVAVTVDGDEVTIDFNGSADQQREWAINCPWNYTYSYTMLTIKAIVDPDTPQTHGSVSPVTMVAPEGSIVNPRPPVPVASRQILSNRIVSTISGALHEAAPGKVPASGSQLFREVMKFTDENTGEHKILMDGSYGGGGAFADRDGYPAISGDTNVKNTPVEVVESEYPVRINQYSMVTDTAGAGKHRGGSATVREWEFLREAEIQTVNERFEFGPYGLAGGHDGTTASMMLNPDTDEAVELGSKDSLHADPGDVLRMSTCAGGGYGDPRDRDPETVRRDVADEIVSAETAQEVYDVDVGE